MRTIQTLRSISVCLIVTFVGCHSAHPPPERDERIITLGGAATETTFALGLGHHVVGVDKSSRWPPEIKDLPRVGQHRSISAESVLALRPSRIFLGSAVGPEAAVKAIENAGVTVVRLQDVKTLEDAKSNMRLVAASLGKEKTMEALITEIDEELASIAPTNGKRTRALFIYARGHKTLLVSGTRTRADTMINLAGADNAVTEFEGFKPLTAEAAPAAKPDVIVIPEAGLKSIGGIDGLLALPGIALTPAGKARAVVAVDDQRLLSLGPRVGQAAKELSDGIAKAAQGR